MLSQTQALDRYKDDIARLAHKCPLFYKKDLVQELRLCVLQCHKLANGNLNDAYVYARLCRRKKSFMKLERNRGMVYCPDDFDALELEALICEHYLSVHSDNQGKRVYSNTPQ